MVLEHDLKKEVVLLFKESFVYLLLLRMRIPSTDPENIVFKILEICRRQFLLNPHAVYANVFFVKTFTKYFRKFEVLYSTEKSNKIKSYF